MATRNNSRRQSRRKHPGQFAGFALIAAAIVLSAAVFSGNNQSKPEESLSKTIVAEYDTELLPVPADYVPAGSRIRDIKINMIAIPTHQIPPEALHTLEAYQEALTLTPLPAGMPFYASNFNIKGGSSNPVIERIPSGMRAITIRVDATSAVEGWAGSGSIVDVLLVEKDKTRVIAEMVKILSAERSVSPVDGNSSPSIPSTVTLLVSQEQALAINTAIPRGKIAFALRSIDDEDQWNRHVFTADNLRSNYSRRKSTVSGYVAVKDGTQKKSYALADGRWIKTDIVPQGFMVAGEEETYE